MGLKVGGEGVVGAYNRNTIFGLKSGGGGKGAKEQGWRSGESTRLPPMWPGLDCLTRRHMWVEFVVGSRLCTERFFFGYSGFPLSSKTNISKCLNSNSIWKSVPN